jgi:hypothetical protein
MELEYRLYEGVDWIHLAQDVVQWRSLVNTVMNLMKRWEFLYQVNYHQLLKNDCSPRSCSVRLLAVRMGLQRTSTKVNLSLCLTKYHAMKTYPMCN